jgi:FkbM family methyltransferase
MENLMTGLRADTMEARVRAYRELLSSIGPGGAGEMYEVLTERLYASALKPGNTAIDCGANVGRHTMGMARAVGESGVVHAFEPSTAVLPYLKSRIAEAGLQDVVRLHEVALGQAEGTASFQVLHGATGMSGLQLRGDLTPELRAKVTVEQITVAVNRLDSIVAAETPVRFIKLDLEGGEFHALVGARALISAQRPLIVFENGRGHNAKDYGYSEDEFFDFFEEAGYSLFDGLGFPFGHAQWNLGSVPWQFVAVARATNNDLALVMQVIAQTLRDNGLRDKDD